MSRAEDLSRQYVLPFLDNHYEKYGEHKQMELTRFDGYDMMSAYEEGYHQSEKDNELTWEDLKLLQDISREVFAEVANGSADYYQIYPTEQSFLEEVLKRFKAQKGG